MDVPHIYAWCQIRAAGIALVAQSRGIRSLASALVVL